MQFTVILYKSYKLLFLKQEGCRLWRVWSMGFALVCTCLCNVLLQYVGLCVLPGAHGVTWRVPTNYPALSPGV